MRVVLLALLLAGCSVRPAERVPIAYISPWANPDTAWTTEPSRLAGEASGVTLVDIHMSADSAAGVDRVVFEFEGGFPSTAIRWIPSTVVECGERDEIGYVVELTPILEVSTTATDDDDQALTRWRPESGQSPLASRHVLDWVLPICSPPGRSDWALVLDWNLGIRWSAIPQEAYRATRLRHPDRLVVELRRP
ncbi:MAG: hypothetical protein AAFQ43_04425 [Bacteroidota bacterium]